MSPQNLGKFVHVEVSDPRVDYQVYHGGHAEQLRLVHWDLQVQQMSNVIHHWTEVLSCNLCVNGVLSLFLLHSIINTSDDGCDDGGVKIPGNTLSSINKISCQTASRSHSANFTSKILFLSSSICSGSLSSLLMICSISIPGGHH